VLMLKKIGIPRSLLFYTYYPLWRTFFEQLGLEVVVSPPTCKTILDEGVREAVDETCLPVKVFYGHVLELCDKVDYLFIPRIVSIERNAFICPKFMGLPDMIKVSLPGIPEVIDTCIDLSKGNSRHFGAFREIGLMFTRNIPKILHAYHQANRKLQKYQSLMLKGQLPYQAMSILEGKQNCIQSVNALRTIAVLGHPYNVYDEHVNMNIIDKLVSMSVRPLTLEMISHPRDCQYQAPLGQAR
jgi:predicted nucleotide-binding protein (sugar kinase/HSP70/actin superfamily)